MFQGWVGSAALSGACKMLSSSISSYCSADSFRNVFEYLQCDQQSWNFRRSLCNELKKANLHKWSAYTLKAYFSLNVNYFYFKSNESKTLKCFVSSSVIFENFEHNWTVQKQTFMLFSKGALILWYPQRTECITLVQIMFCQVVLPLNFCY